VRLTFSLSNNSDPNAEAVKQQKAAELRAKYEVLLRFVPEPSLSDRMMMLRKCVFFADAMLSMGCSFANAYFASELTNPKLGQAGADGRPSA
jgi:hypothetical protein